MQRLFSGTVGYGNIAIPEVQHPDPGQGYPREASLPSTTVAESVQSNYAWQEGSYAFC